MNVHTKATMASLPIFLQQQDRSEETVSVPIVPISQSPESVFEKKQAASSDQFPQEFAYNSHHMRCVGILCQLIGER